MKKIFFFALFTLALAGCSSDSEEGLSLSKLTITTLQPSSFTFDTGMTGATVTGAKMDKIGNSASFGVVYSTQQNPSISDSQSTYENNATTGGYTSKLTNLEPGTTYYARAFVSKGYDVVYGNQVTFTMSAIVTTAIAKNITSRSFRATITSSNNVDDEIEARGICYSLTPNPTIDNAYAAASTGGSGLVTIDVVNALLPNKTYYAKSYVRYNYKYYYGNQVTFKTCGYLGGSGGWVYYDKGETTDGWRYLEVATDALYKTNDLWGQGNVAVSGTSQDMGAGVANTNAIISVNNYTNVAARMCYDAVINSKTDWFLGSLQELEPLHDLYVSGILESGSSMWTSCQYSATDAITYTPSNQTYYHYTKNQHGPVIWPIRRF